MGGDGPIGSVRLRRGHPSRGLVGAAWYAIPGIFAYPLLIAQGFAAEPSTPPYLFATPAYANYATVLGFDLRDERGPVVTIVINHSVGGDNASIDLALPIKIKQSSPSEEALFRIGAFERWTLVTYTDVPRLGHSKSRFTLLATSCPILPRKIRSYGGRFISKSRGSFGASCIGIPTRTDQTCCRAISFEFRSDPSMRSRLRCPRTPSGSRCAGNLRCRNI